MNDRERFQATMHFRPVDRIPYWEMPVHELTLKRWQEEGMVKNASLEEYFNLDKRELIEVKFTMWPEYDLKVLSKNPEWWTYTDEFGVTKRRRRAGNTDALPVRGSESEYGMPDYIDYPVKTRCDFEKIKKRYDPTTPERYPKPWDDYVACMKKRNYPLYAQAWRHIGLFGPIRNLMGPVQLLYALHDDPLLIHDMMEFLTEFLIAIIERIGSNINLDFVIFFEDIGYKTSTLISPRMFSEFMAPCYKRITNALRRCGTDILFLDSDGCNDPLIPQWIACGINGLSPLEVGAEAGPAELRKKYGKDLLLFGGIDKKVLIKDKKAIEEEVFSKVPYMIESGGYIPTLDHIIPPNIPLENFAYYRKLIVNIAEGKYGSGGIPLLEEW